jgi:hypothetical protein
MSDKHLTQNLQYQINNLIPAMISNIILFLQNLPNNGEVWLDKHYKIFHMLVRKDK